MSTVVTPTTFVTSSALVKGIQRESIRPMCPHCNGNSVFIFLFWELRGLSPISTFMCLWAIYIFPGSVHIFPPVEKADPSWEYIIRSQTLECGNWDWGPDIPFLGIFVSNFRHFVFAVHATSGCICMTIKPRHRSSSYPYQICCQANLASPSTPALQRHCTENLKKIFLERKLRGRSPNFYIHIFVSDLYIPTSGLPIWLEENSWTDRGKI